MIVKGAGDGSSVPESLTAAALLPDLYRADLSYGWNAGMRAVTLAMLDGVAMPDGPLLEAGCGGGQMLAELGRRYPHRALWGIDLHPLALAYAQARLAGRAGLVCASLEQTPFPAQQFALVLALDSFDQEGVDLAAALAESYRLLRPGGRLVVRVSAHPQLYGEHDRAFHTGRRYTRREVVGAMASAGFVTARVTYSNLLLGAPVAGLRLLQRRRVIPWQPEVYAGSTVNRLVAWALAREASWLRRADLPLGLSLWAVGEKR
ncbi:MAG TPA: class I SAM-dependent methyltransferase [Caldilineaceae bacterium]|nr:class I SAM-dependent methyltransferase [Caldilineaceae bacterium]